MTTQKQGLKIPRYFTKEGVNPEDMFTYESRTSEIKNPDGSMVFQMHDVEVPNFWSQVATDILAQKYFRKAGVPLRNEKGDLLLDENGKVITGSENSIKQVAHRLAGCWRNWGEKYGYFASSEDAQIFYDEMTYMVINQSAAPNSPQWFTTGLNFAYGLTGPPQGHSYVDPVTGKLEYSKDAYTRSQPHACFIQSVNDDLVTDGGIFSLLTREARIFKYGSGTGSNFSKIRGKGETLSGGGTSSGLMSFLKIFDTAAGSIKSGGTTRRAAKMCSLDLDHPEIQDFIWWKVREEEKVAGLVAGSKTLKKRLSKIVQLSKGQENPLQNPEVKKLLQQAAKDNIPVNYMVRALDLAKQGYELPLQEFDTHYESEAYLTVSGQNSNNSIRIPNEFFKALDEGREWNLTARRSGEVMETMPASKLWDDIGYCAWASADPGLQYNTTINEWHTCPEDGPINGSNPCSEYMFLDDTACNLASINLVKFYTPEQGFDIEGYRHAIRLWTTTLEISVLMAQFPSDPIAIKSFQFRTLGLGYANLGTLLMLQGIPYDSEEGRVYAGAMAAIMTGDSYATSAEMASILGPFQMYEKNKEHMLKVIRNHKRAAYNNTDYEQLEVLPQSIDQEICPKALLETAHDAWDKALSLGEKYGYRNAQTTVLAPTGTIGLVMDCDTTGVEPDYAIVKFKKLAGGGFFKIVNSSVPGALRKLGYSEFEIDSIIKYCLGRASLNGSPHINAQTLSAKGITGEAIVNIEKQLGSNMDIRHVLNQWTIGEDLYNQLMQGKEGDLLEILGFSQQQISEANEYICGTMTLEGAPHLKEEHLSIFDCANKCGKKGQRYIHPYGHLKMLAAAQAFISGAISKTINMPTDWTVDQIKQAYYDAWKMGTKATALYRDGCKLSQPLNSTLEGNVQLKEIFETPLEEKEVGILVINNVIKRVKVGPRKLELKGREDKSRLKEVSYTMEELIPAQKVLLDTVVNAVNFSLSQGMSSHLIAEKLLSADGHPVLNELREFLLEFEDVGIVKKPVVTKTIDSKDEKEKCRSCGASQMRQNGTCMLCEVCGETTGCS
ncbi:adenosylcobalamin-dependent ribonucleoside-diphosphate reductase [Candidatus Woesearchaeota archaeon]|nr:adenosylcobalamin-dependent ribonucleoside-diphosphate reductase [Candidatus Woesearchaeota archaeon]MBT4150463.1 adenosylcobalamin-dependent ribonucleoside-diphosphate reductase [Candidatus Woesearchaeota archaeon]MBT4434671.1 adenosylcobalamin-dependent ribonucleoside-diphosphate reductase [Candidatus Woesearchaeota archaeon]